MGPGRTDLEAVPVDSQATKFPLNRNQRKHGFLS